MRVAVLIIGLMLTVGLFFQAVLVTGLSGAAHDKASSDAGAIGVFMALLWLVSCGLVIPAPRVSMVLFVLSTLLGFIGAANYGDLAIWAVIALILAFFSYLGYRGKRKADAKEAERDALLRQMAGQAAPLTVPRHSADSF